uniref:No apical meristem-associated C-terminal domain-containing protein n=1 Tax=Oryza brachyantha TaxID=4533 RepID=J3LJM9_ORYBR
MDQALELYRSLKGQPFTYQHCWKAVADSLKWNAYVSCSGEGPRKRTPDLNMNAEPMVRPIGVKRAKKGKVSGEVPLEVRDQLKTLVDACESQKEGIEDMKEFQTKMAEHRVEAAAWNFKAVHEKEAKVLEHKNFLLGKFTELLQIDTSKMEAWAKDAHPRAVNNLSAQIWGGVGSADAV